MANSKLRKKHWKIPNKYLRMLDEKLKAYQGNKKAEGYVRIKNILSKGKLTYENMKFIKHTLEKNKDNNELYNLNGGVKFERWINDTLDTARKSIETGKKVKKETGMNNAYIKSHEKDSSKGSKPRTPKLHKSMSINNINNNNMNYENLKIMRVLITESQVNYLIKESRQSEKQAYNILKRGNIDNIDNVIDLLKNADNSVSKIYIPHMAFYYASGYQNIDDFRTIYDKYDNLKSNNRIGVLQISKKSGITINGNNYNNFLDFSEFIDGEYNKYQSPSNNRKIEKASVKFKDKPIWSGNGIDIYFGKDFTTCIRYTQGGLTGSKYSFCIGNPTMKMFQSYRDVKTSTFYYIVDRNKFIINKEGSFDLSDPLHMVVFDNTQYGVELTDANNTTGTISEYGKDVEAYIKYLKSKGVPVEKLKNIKKSEKEEEESRLLGSKNVDLDWFKKLPYEFKSKYIGRGHLLSDEQFDYLIN